MIQTNNPLLFFFMIAKCFISQVFFLPRCYVILHKFLWQSRQTNKWIKHSKTCSFFCLFIFPPQIICIFMSKALVVLCFNVMDYPVHPVKKAEDGTCPLFCLQHSGWGSLFPWHNKIIRVKLCYQSPYRTHSWISKTCHVYSWSDEGFYDSAWSSWACFQLI